MAADVGQPIGSTSGRAYSSKPICYSNFRPWLCWFFDVDLLMVCEPFNLYLASYIFGLLRFLGFQICLCLPINHSDHFNHWGPRSLLMSELCHIFGIVTTSLFSFFHTAISAVSMHLMITQRWSCCEQRREGGLAALSAHIAWDVMRKYGTAWCNYCFKLCTMGLREYETLI